MSNEVADKTNDINKIEKEIYKSNERIIKSIREKFKKVTSNDNKLKEYFKSISSAQTYSNIDVAGSIIAGINTRNIKNIAHNISEQEEIPYNKEQQKLIDLYEDLLAEQKVLEGIFQESETEI